MFNPKIFLLAFFLIILILLNYLFPQKELISIEKYINTNFSINNSDMQFYPSLRFINKNISYQIFNCTLKKEKDMNYAFSILENLTLLDFYPVTNNEQISVTCDEKLNESRQGLFIAGEGGPTEIIHAGEINLILKGKILLITPSQCTFPNVALHELLHVLGFKHSENPGNIMYNVTNCNQEIGEDILSLINDLYSIPNYPDLLFQEVVGIQNGHLLNINFTIFNRGLKDSENFYVEFYSGENMFKKINFGPIQMGRGRLFSIQNVIIKKNTDELFLLINYLPDELNKRNNKIKLEIKK
jgi:hypothetical protein